MREVLKLLKLLRYYAIFEPFTRHETFRMDRLISEWAARLSGNVKIRINEKRAGRVVLKRDPAGKLVLTVRKKEERETEESEALVKNSA